MNKLYFWAYKQVSWEISWIKTNFSPTIFLAYHNHSNPILQSMQIKCINFSFYNPIICIHEKYLYLLFFRKKFSYFGSDTYILIISLKLLIKILHLEEF